jgi:putative redox protein
MNKGQLMKTTLQWKQGMCFEAESDGNIVTTDAKPPLGQKSGMTPKELLAAGLAGCTAMDVIALLKKHKQVFESFVVDVDIETTSGVQPAVFKSAILLYKAVGSIDKEIFLESVMLSQTKFCGVSAMLSKAFPIQYKVFLNNEEVGTGQAHF